MTAPARVHRSVVLGTLVGATAVAAVALGSRRAAPLPVYWDAPPFALVTQRADTLRRADLEGMVWVASFTFTNCTDVCPLITRTMARLRDSLAANGLLGRALRLVSITVDPARDSPATLRAYAARFGGSPPEHWAFLTGSPRVVRQVIERGFRVAADVDTTPRPETESDYQVRHTPRLLLVDAEGRVRGTYPALEPDAVERVLAAVRRLVGGR